MEENAGYAGTSKEEDDYYVNDSLPSCPNVKKKGSPREHCEIVVEENGAYNAAITHSQSPIYDDGIYYWHHKHPNVLLMYTWAVLN